MYRYIESIFVLYVTLCLFGGLNWNNKIIIIFIMMWKTKILQISNKKNKT